MPESRDLVHAAVQSLVTAGMLAAERTEEAERILANTFAPLAAAAFSATAVGYDDLYTDAYEYADRVSELTDAIHLLSRCVPNDSTLGRAAARYVIDQGVGSEATQIDAIGIAAALPSPTQAEDLRRLLAMGTEPALDALDRALREMSADARTPALAPEDLTPFLACGDRAVREASLLVLARLRTAPAETVDAAAAVDPGNSAAAE